MWLITQLKTTMIINPRSEKESTLFKKKHITKEPDIIQSSEMTAVLKLAQTSC